jgi:hypothetical protein
VGKLFNSKFINAKIDMEGVDGVVLASTYEVKAYPTLLFIDGNGKMVHKVLGYKTVEELMGAANDSRDPNKQYASLMRMYKGGKLTDGNYTNLLKALDDAGEDEQSALVASAFLAKNSKWMVEPQLHMLVNYSKDVSSSQFKFLINNEDAIGKMNQYKNISDQLDMAVRDYVVKETIDQTEMKFDKEKARGLFKTYRAATADRLYCGLAFDYAVYKKDAEEIEVAGLELGTFASQLTSKALNELAWQFFETVKNTASLKKAIEWALLSIKKESNFFNNDSVANLYAKLGDKVMARKYAEAAIKLGMEEGEDTEDTQKLLKSL